MSIPPASRNSVEFTYAARCTCPGESHPGPMHTDGSYVGRAAPEIDVIEAIVTDGVGMVCHISRELNLPLINYQGLVFRTIWTIQCKFQHKMSVTKNRSDIHLKAKYMYNQTPSFTIYQDNGNTQPNSFRGGEIFFPRGSHELLIITTYSRCLPADRQWTGNTQSRLLRIQQRLL